MSCSSLLSELAYILQWSLGHQIHMYNKNIIFTLQQNRFDMCCCVKTEPEEDTDESVGVLFRIFKNHYAPFLLKEWVRPIVVRS